MQKITPCLWFNGRIKEALEFYTSVFKDSKIKATACYPKGSPMPEGEYMTAVLELHGQEFMLLNGGPQFPFTYSVSFVVNCVDQEDVDYYWDHLTAGGGQEEQCGWVKDRFGLSWQVVPIGISRLYAGTPQQSERVMQAMLQMKKLDIAALEAAYAG